MSGDTNSNISQTKLDCSAQNISDKPVINKKYSDTIVVKSAIPKHR